MKYSAPTFNSPDDANNALTGGFMEFEVEGLEWAEIVASAINKKQFHIGDYIQLQFGPAIDLRIHQPTGSDVTIEFRRPLPKLIVGGLQRSISSLSKRGNKVLVVINGFPDATLRLT